MYMSGLGFWTEIFKIGTAAFKTVGPALVSIAAQNALQRRFNDSGQSVATNLPIQSAAASPIPQVIYQPAPRPANLIEGVPNVVLLGGAALLVLVIASRRN